MHIIFQEIWDKQNNLQAITVDKIETVNHSFTQEAELKEFIMSLYWASKVRDKDANFILFGEGGTPRYTGKIINSKIQLNEHF